MADLDQLFEEHREILRVVERLRYLIGQPKRAPQLHLFALRHELSSTLIGHLKREDWVLYPRLLASADPQIASVALTFSDEMGGLGAAYTQHCRKWDANAIASDWAGYCLASGVLLDALVKRITRENRELYPLLRKVDGEVRASAAA
jgi:hemerythrin-like domain-containing protein